ncbi:Hypothetical protein CINCED_3A006611 [Cinara cedri]|uniref:Uncharacterized protein n=1 Tax=Cinara cedri TaxID=506608 RepID=A0A5E4N1B0_9HEMI|nr:Hypothetical protein CINCED_3A006611 [Cinara cedri]
MQSPRYSLLLAAMMVAAAAARIITVNVTHMCDGPPPSPRVTVTKNIPQTSENNRSSSLLTASGLQSRPTNAARLHSRLRPSPSHAPPTDSVRFVSRSCLPLELMESGVRYANAPCPPSTTTAYSIDNTSAPAPFPVSIRPTDGPVASKLLMRFPSAKLDENVKLDQPVDASRTDYGGAAAAIDPFGVGTLLSSMGLRFVGVAESAVMWHPVPAELALDVYGNAYSWEVVAKKVNVRFAV